MVFYYINNNNNKENKQPLNSCLSFYHLLKLFPMLILSTSYFILFAILIDDLQIGMLFCRYYLNRQDKLIGLPKLNSIVLAFD